MDTSEPAVILRSQGSVCEIRGGNRPSRVPCDGTPASTTREQLEFSWEAPQNNGEHAVVLLALRDVLPEAVVLDTNLRRLVCVADRSFASAANCAWACGVG